MSWRRLAKHRAEYALVLGARGLDRLLGARLSEGMAAWLGRVVYRLGIRRGVAESQLRAAFPDRDAAWVRATARASYEHLGREAMAMLRLSRQGAEDVIAATEVEGIEALREAVDAGRGAVVVTGHFGNWEIGGASVAARGVPLDVVAQRQKNPYFDRLINHARARLGMTVIRRGGATRAALRSLRKGRAVALVADQDARRRGIFVPFFGRPASTHRGPAVLALRSGAPVFMGTAIRQPGGIYRSRILPVPVPEGSDPEERADRLTAALAAALEAAVREAPGSYLWQHRRWKTEPLPATAPDSRPDRANGNGDPGAQV